MRRGVVEVINAAGDKLCCRAGELFSYEDIVWKDGTYSNDAIARTPVELVRLDRLRFLNLLHNHPTMAVQLIATAGAPGGAPGPGAGGTFTLPQGIDADFENVGGKIFHAVFARLNNFGRVAFCGAISEYQDQAPMAGPEKMFSIVQKRLTLQGFIVSDHAALMGDFVSEVGGLVKAGKLKSRETIVDGLDRAPQAFMGLLKGENFGKLVVKVA